MNFGFGPDERFWSFVVGRDEGVDMSLELINGVEGAPLRDLPARIENQISIWFNQDVWVGV